MKGIFAMQYVIGIDTGGTYTDAVIYAPEERRVIACAKALTTREDLSLGILNALDGLDPCLARRAEVICLSTTLATNACVEGKGARSKLLFLGVDPKSVSWVGTESGLDDPARIAYAPEGLTDWSAFPDAHKAWLEDAQAIGIVALNAAKDQGAEEKAARSALSQHTDIPMICGHELSDALNSIHRGASALLNGQLVPVLAEFLDAIHSALRERQIAAPIAIMNSSGSLMSAVFTGRHPVETILCGPAASVVGANALVGAENAIIVDMGGTTTDIALVRDHIPRRAAQGIQIGQWHTATKGIFVHTIGLGGDSAVRFDWSGQRLYLDHTRVIPLCSAASRWPQVIPALSALLARCTRHTLMLHEFYLRIKDIEGNPYYTEEERRFCRILGSAPLPVRQAAEAMERDPYTFRIDRLEREGIVIRCGLTPTDIMHLKGDFTPFARQAAELGAKFVANCAGISVDELCDWVYNEVKKSLYLNIAEILLRETLPRSAKQGLSPQLTACLEHAWALSRDGGNAQMKLQLTTPSVLIGVGAPIHVFLPDVARALGTQCVIPEHAGVVNAIGAAACNVTVTKAVSIEPKGTKYSVSLERGVCLFPSLEEALDAARQETEALARREAIARGAEEPLMVHPKEDIRTVQTGYGGNLFLGAEVSATVIGSFSVL